MKKLLILSLIIIQSCLGLSQQIVKLCPDSQTSFKYYVIGNDSSLLWSYNNITRDGTSLEINWTVPGEYIITAEYQFACNSVKRIYNVKVEKCDNVSIYFPSAFTPNGDGVNDTFRGYGENIIEYNLVIYNRWGELLFESDSLTIGWTGYYNNSEEPVQDGMYIYVSKWLDIRKKWGLKNGTVILLH